ncbi:hypothetical protein [Paractinoplanes rishiriensis]|uniref:Uncharacterized protein n=1 Tax=Paractinoplanes rishiriensis TaxID=1050105 RepID=A0A919K5Q6_9ACTN|nr:hypothetical protein [Actinoplanes rishiriensis]GIE99297.1 hypothetical protein Ari01nite_67620 [Actinoplanes rishiriensis]
MVSRFGAFTLAVVWTALGLAVGLTALQLAAQGGLGDAGLIGAVIDAFRSNMRWWMVLTPACLLIGTIWIGMGARTARSTAALGAQAALIGLAAALFALLLFLIAGQALA